MVALVEGCLSSSSNMNRSVQDDFGLNHETSGKYSSVLDDSEINEDNID